MQANAGSIRYEPRRNACAIRISQDQITVPVFLAFDGLDVRDIGDRRSYVLKPALKRRWNLPRLSTTQGKFEPSGRNFMPDTRRAWLTNRKAIERKGLNTFFEQPLEPRAHRKTVNVGRHIGKG